MRPTAWKKYWDKKKDCVPKLSRAIIKIDKDIILDLHTDINLYDYKNKKAWKGDLV